MLKMVNNINESNISNSVSVSKQHIDIYDHHFVSAFRIEDQDFINRRWKNRIVSANGLLKEMQQYRKSLVKLYKRTKYKSQTLLAKIKYVDSETVAIRSDQVLRMKDFYSYLQRDYMDKTIPDPYPKPIQNVYEYDVYLSDGIDIIGAQITSKSSVVWEHVKYGTGIRKAEVNDQDLQTPLGSFPIEEGGSFSSIGDQIRLFCVLPETIQNSYISEYSINEFAEGGKILSRTVLDKPIKHLIREDLPTITNVTYLIPHQDI